MTALTKADIELRARRAQLSVFIWQVEQGWHDSHLMAIANDIKRPLQVRAAARKRYKQFKKNG